MRKSDLRLSIALAFLAPLPAFSQVPVAPVELPKVIFCSGQCFAVDEKGVRTTVTKGVVLREGQRLETGPGAYAQLKVGQAAELAVSERGRVGFDQKSVGGRDLVILDQGRIRMIAGQAMGKLEKRALELRTVDGTFSLKGADVEVKKAGTVSAANPTYLKLNNGGATLRSGQAQVALSKDAVQGVTGGKVITDKAFSLNEVALPRTRSTRPDVGPGTKIDPVPVAGLAPLPQVLTISTVTAPTTTSTLSTCLTCTTTISPTYTLSPTYTTSPTISTDYVNKQLSTASTCLTCSTLTALGTTSGTTSGSTSGTTSGGTISCLTCGTKQTYQLNTTLSGSLITQ